MKLESVIKRKGTFKLTHFRDGKIIGKQSVDLNLVTTEGTDYIANVAYNGGGVGAQNTWYLALFKNNVSPVAGDDSTVVVTKFGELDTELVNATRPVWIPNAANNGALSSNSDSPAVFTIDPGAADTTLYGAMFISTSGKASATGKLMAASRFTNSRTVEANDVLNLTYEIELTDV